MKKVLITGVNSFIGKSLDSWLKQYSDDIKVDKISLRNSEWQAAIF